MYFEQKRCTSCGHITKHVYYCSIVKMKLRGKSCALLMRSVMLWFTLCSEMFPHWICKMYIRNTAVTETTWIGTNKILFWTHLSGLLQTHRNFLKILSHFALVCSILLRMLTISIGNIFIQQLIDINDKANFWTLQFPIFYTYARTSIISCVAKRRSELYITDTIKDIIICKTQNLQKYLNSEYIVQTLKELSLSCCMTRKECIYRVSE